MRYKRGNVVISVEQIDGFGKNPGLYIGTRNPNMMLKVASFGNYDKAEMFSKWLEYMVGFTDEPPEVTQNER